MKIVLVSTVYPLPENCGKARVLMGILRSLKTAPSVTEVHFVQIGGKEPKSPTELDVKYAWFKGPSAIESIYNLFLDKLLFKFTPLQEAFTYCRSSKRALHDYIIKIEADIVVLDTVRIVQYYKKGSWPKARCIVYLDDLFSVRYERVLEVIGKFPAKDIDPLGNFSSFVPRFMRGLTERAFFLRILLTYEMWAVRRMEIKAARTFEEVLLINSEEVELLNTRSGCATAKNLKLRTNPVVEGRVCRGDGRYFVFVGDLKLAHNRVSIKEFIKQSIGRIETAIPGYHVKIIGKGADEELVNLCEGSRVFQLCGYVSDLDAVLESARGMIVPLVFGSGVKIKTIDALRMGLPVVSSRFGVEGIGLKAGVQYRSADSIEECLLAMEMLTNDQEFGVLSRGARDWFMKSYHPEVVEREHHMLFTGNNGFGNS